MLITKLDGGLGNQMFQYAYGKRISVQYGIPLKLDIFNLFEYRKYEMDVFNLDSEIATHKDMLLFDRRNLSFSEKVIFKIKHGFSKPLYLFEKEGEELFSLPAKAPKNILIRGHWQKEHYFKNIEKVIRRDFSFPVITGEANQTFKRLIVRTNSVSVHIRRGDYLLEQNNKVHGVLPLKYYLAAIQFIRESTDNPVFYIFSDDAEWVKEKFTFEGGFYFIIGNENKLSYIDMQLMSYCKHNIIANSSFSWWGAWLNDYSDKIVIAPSQWFSDPIKNSLHKNILPKEWIKL